MSKPSGEAMEIARGHVDHASDCHNYRLKSDDQDDAECELVSCEFKALSESLALAIDALVQRAVERERERLLTECERLRIENNLTRTATLRHGFDEALEAFRSALRATPN